MTLFLIRGLPGSGKSTLAKRLAPVDWRFEADMFFVNKDGTYESDASKLPDAHVWCQSQVETAMKDGAPVIAVSNTFTRRWELQPYYDMAKQHGYAVVEITLSGNLFPNIHDVPQSVIERMKDRWEP